MPLPGKRWRHVTISTYGSWLPGDSRGWRSKKHRKHSSGDYKSPPPRDEHAGLHEYSKSISRRTVVIPAQLRPLVGRKMLHKLIALDHRILAMSVAGMHVHVLVELPSDLKAARKEIGLCKSASSHAIRKKLPGRVWARDGDFEPVDSSQHQQRVYRYILNQKGAWIWCYRDPIPED